MKNFFMERAHRVAVALAIVVLLACATIGNAAEGQGDDKWQFTLIPYVWLPSVNGSLNIVRPDSPISGNVDIGSSDYLSNLSFAAMLTMEAKKGNWSVLSDLMYVNFSDDNRQALVPGRLGEAFTVRAETGLKALVFEIAGAYSAYQGENANIDFLGGLRYAGIKTTLSLDIAPALPVDIPSPNLSQKKDLVDPIVGVKGRIELGKKWFLPYYF
ncbi:MAG TPA: hypothetical protein VEI96_07405, partial [Thermodesulfovibrionales bacterium]|nr:hypothetical protein [Thermodesulfovibrionales bacterium]